MLNERGFSCASIAGGVVWGITLYVISYVVGDEVKRPGGQCGIVSDRTSRVLDQERYRYKRGVYEAQQRSGIAQYCMQQLTFI